MVNKAWFGYITVTTQEYVEVSLGSWFIQVEPTQSENIFWSPSWTDHGMGHSGRYGWNFKFPSWELESPQNLGPDASWMKQIGGGHPTLSWCPSIIFDIAHATGQIRHPNVDIQNLLKKLVLVQVETSQSEEVKFPTNKPTLIYCLL